MNLDPRTMMFLNFVSSYIISVGLLNFSKGYLSQVKNIKHWAYATLIQSFAWILIGLRGTVPEFFSIILANIFILTSAALYFNILCQFMNIKIKPYLIFLPVLISALFLTYYTYYSPNFGYRVIIASACAAFILYNSSMILFFNRRRNSTYIITGIIFFICATIFLMRALYFLFAPAVIEDSILSKSIINDIINLSCFIFSVLLSFGFMMMSNNRYKAEQKALEDEILHDKNILDETSKLARIGSWSINVSTKDFYMSKLTKEILEVPSDYKSDLKSALQFYKDEQTRNTISAIIKQASISAQSFDINVQITTAKGNDRWVRILGRSEFINGVCSGILGIFQDITKEVILKEGIKLIEDRFKTAFEHSAVGTAIVGLDGTFEAVNEQICEITGYTKSEIQNKTFQDITHPDDLNIDLNYLKQLHDGLIKSYSMEKRYFHKNGDIIWVFLAASAVRDNNNKVLYYIAQIININNRKKIENELQHSQQQYKSLFYQNPDGVFSLNLEGKFTTANENLLKLVNCNFSELKKLSLAQLTTPEELQKIKHYYKEANKGIPQNFNASFVNLKNENKTLNNTYIPIMIDGSVAGIYGIAKDITEQVINSRNLEQSELSLKEAQKIARLGNYRFRLKDKNLICSDIINEITGLNTEKVKELKNLEAIIAPEFRNNFLTAAFKSIKLKNAINYDCKISHAQTGEERWITLTGAIEYDNQGNPEMVYGTVQDITERKLVEKKLKQSEESYRKIVETAQEGIWMIDKENKSVFVNQKMCEILEYEEAEIIGKKSIDFMSEESSKRAQISLLRRREGIKEKLELNFITKSGKSIWASLSANPVYDENNNYDGSLAMVTDITQNKLATEMIIKSEEKYRNLFNNNPIPIFIWDLENYKIIEVNNAASREYGYNREEFLAMSVLDLRLKEEYGKIIQFANNFKDLPDGNLVKTWKHINKSGELMDMNISSFRIIYNDRPCVLAMAENITDKKVAEDLIQKSFEEIRMLTNHLQSIREEERTNIAREIHDELGQQLTVLKMNILSLINKQENITPKIRIQSDKMIEMVDKSLETVKKISTQLRPSILDDLGIVAALEWQAMEFQSKTNIVCQFNTCCVTDNFTEKINTTVFRIFQESLTNIARHAKASIVSSTLYQENGHLILIVNDNGIGICNENKNKKTSFGLLGMKERATMLNGEIIVQRSPSGGTDVTLKIPVSC